jgi:GTP cyclohydrolase I
MLREIGRRRPGRWHEVIAHAEEAEQPGDRVQREHLPALQVAPHGGEGVGNDAALVQGVQHSDLDRAEAGAAGEDERDRRFVVARHDRYASSTGAVLTGVNTIGKRSRSRGAKTHMTSTPSQAAGLALAAPLATRDSHREIDHQGVQRAARELLLALGADIDSVGLKDTPRRVADAYVELLTPQPFRATTFPNDDGYDELIVARAIPFNSLCMHHLLPFHGVAHIGYLPAERIIGLSKLGRVVELFARDLQIQERLTTQIAGWLQRELEPKGVGVVLEAEHMCMSLRGVQKFGAKTVTSALHGLIRDDARTRQEFLALTTRTSHDQ